MDTKISQHMNRPLQEVDPDIAEVLREEGRRQGTGLELIPSENFVSEAVLEATASVFTNKYAEGYPGKRYYGGCEYVDIVEQLAIDRVKQLFGADAANVQPNSGSQANQGVFFAMLKPGDTIMGMSLAEGGHLTHGSPVNMSGKWFNVVSYGLNEAEDIDYDKTEELAKEHKPKLIVAGASAFALKIDFERFSKIAKSVGAYFMVDMAHYAGLIAAGVYPNPVPFADFVTTTTHKSLRGPRGGVILMKAEYEKQINSAIFPGIQGGPLMHVIAGKAVAFKEALSPEFKAYQQQVVDNARVLAETLVKRGLRISSCTRALCPGLGAALAINSRRQLYHSHTRRGSRPNASAVASSSGLCSFHRPPAPRKPKSPSHPRWRSSTS